MEKKLITKNIVSKFVVQNLYSRKITLINTPVGGCKEKKYNLKIKSEKKVKEVRPINIDKVCIVK